MAYISKHDIHYLTLSAFQQPVSSSLLLNLLMGIFFARLNYLFMYYNFLCPCLSGAWWVFWGWEEVGGRSAVSGRWLIHRGPHKDWAHPSPSRPVWTQKIRAATHPLILVYWPQQTSRLQDSVTWISGAENVDIDFPWLYFPRSVLSPVLFCTGRKTDRSWTKQVRK